jgi:hypothetical protein
VRFVEFYTMVAYHTNLAKFCILSVDDAADVVQELCGKDVILPSMHFYRSGEIIDHAEGCCTTLREKLAQLLPDPLMLRLEGHDFTPDSPPALDLDEQLEQQSPGWVPAPLRSMFCSRRRSSNCSAAHLEGYKTAESPGGTHGNMATY